MDEEQVVEITLTAQTNDKIEALKAVETLQRLMVGLAFDGLDVNLNVSVFEFTEEYEHETEGEDEI